MTSAGIPDQPHRARPATDPTRENVTASWRPSFVRRGVDHRSSVGCGPVEGRSSTERLMFHDFGPRLDGDGAEPSNEMAMDGATSRVIRTPDQRLRVFVSSTLGELAPERRRFAGDRAAPSDSGHVRARRPSPSAGAAVPRLSGPEPGVHRGLLAAVWLGGAGRDRVRARGRVPVVVGDAAAHVHQRAFERSRRATGRADRSLCRQTGLLVPAFRRAEELGELVEGDLAILLSERFEASNDGSLAAHTRGAGAPALPVPLTPTIGRRPRSSR